MDVASEVRVELDIRNRLGEGIVWSIDRGRLLWVDIDSKEFWSHAPGAGGPSTTHLEEAICSFGLTAGGELLVARETGVALFDPTTRELRSIQALIDPSEHTDGVRLNDGRCDRYGRFIVGGLDPKGKKRGKLYSVESHGDELRVRVLLEGIACANSTCFSPDGRTMYFADTPEQVIWAFDYDQETGTPSARRVFCDLHEQPGNPDGSTVDAEGFLWNAQWGGSRVVRYDPMGRIDRVIELPARFPTCPAFGRDDLTTLYITSARKQEPTQADGALLSVRTDVHGLREPVFRLSAG